MIDLYTWSTPNGRKVSILLEELGLDYQVHPIDIQTGAQKAPEFLAINPNGRIPAIVDRETGLALMESGAILWYLAEKHGAFLPEEPAARMQVMGWLMWQMGGFGPMLGQAHHFLHFNPGTSAYAEKRFGAEVTRLYAVLDAQLEGRTHIAGAYSIADMACWPWVARHEWHGVNLADFPNVRAWYRRLRERPAVQRGYQVPTNVGEIPEG
ncbi:glutathione S-transferase family protein [Salipiger mangrovisoli]|uniref:Glutathione S-transferase N-terminal domain-containing protein n=1 Tax=Salipiger mangrovisoli TaxID=2865933 RepID=A0ABR9WYK0_9RHOB|nr:glutathione S-transferase N-terminal domain-containing protein [Salipiger mangrovisoli]MBE9636368.1 glutathione S-transferase N-terminal domain-containing protein [Salipiger mangrovisoli]